MNGWHEFNSSQVHSMAHDPVTGKMQVKFKNGATYEYDGVDEGTADAFRNADSAGKFMHENIRGQYPHKQVA